MEEERKGGKAVAWDRSWSAPRTRDRRSGEEEVGTLWRVILLRDREPASWHYPVLEIKISVIRTSFVIKLGEQWRKGSLNVKTNFTLS